METSAEFEQWLMDARAGSDESLGLALEACRVYLLLVAQRELDVPLQAKGGASDLVQETFIDAHRAFGRFTSSTREEFLAWLRALLLNNVQDFRRRYGGTQKRAASRETALNGGTSSADWRNELPADSLTPSGEMVHQESMQALAQALQRLPDDYQQVVQMRYIENLPFDEIAARLNRTSNAVRKLFGRAIERLQQLYEE